MDHALLRRGGRSSSGTRGRVGRAGHHDDRRAPTPALSRIVVPILGGDRVLGSIVLENYEREHAFGEAEVRLLSTVAASMGVALENARLFDETQRRARETAALAEVGREICRRRSTSRR